LYPEGERYAAAKVRVLQPVDESIGTQGMIGGQMADLEAEEISAPTEDLVETIHENKTGRLMRASLAAGAILAFGSDSDLHRLDLYGRKIGLAFQIKDDLLDVESDSATLGKKSGKDAAAGKATFPVVWGVERSHRVLAQTIEEAVETARGLPGGGGRLPDLARFIGERKS
ncbi:MAG: polyprenyl synthetase family protein, partial [Thermoanaerobaculia bacterium]